MGIYSRKKNLEDENNNIFWTTMADLLLGLAIIFMTLFVLAMTGFTQQTIDLQQTQMEAAKQMAEKLKEADIEAEVDKLTGNVKISDLELFEVGSYTLSEKGRKIFSKKELADNVANIIVQGHTDSQSYAGLKTPNEQFSKNMELSLLRANAVEQYIFKTPYDKKYDKILRNLLTVEGRSFAEPVLTPDGKEDYAKSRRVELKLRVQGNTLTKVFGLSFGDN